jgi:hypothetical protein
MRSILFFIFIAILISSCEKKEYKLPVPKDALQNDVIKRKLGPNIVGDTIDFAYAIGIPAARGKIVSAQVEATIAGSSTTYIDPKSYYTNSSGLDVGIIVASPAVNSGNITSVTLTKDTNAVTFRYYYVIPPEAKGKSVSFTFSAKSSNGESVSYKMGPYTVSNMDIVRRLTVTDGAAMYVSIADMKIYSETEAAQNPGKIDLVYLYRNYVTGAFNHALVAPSADPTYLPGVTLPSGVSNSSRVIKVFGLQDYNLAYMQYGTTFVDDPDLQKADFTTAPNYAIDLKAESGVWVETADKKFKAYVFVNSVNNSAKSAVISFKRLAM